MGTQACRSSIAKAFLLKKIYKILFRSFGPQNWWPARTPFEVMVGAILVQNTNWKNTKRAIDHLRARHLLTAKKMNAANLKTLASCIRSAGYFNVKAKRLRNFLVFFIAGYGADIKKMRAQEGAQLRNELLEVHGIGPETADSILLYALCKPFFVVDAYTKRIFLRHGIIKKDASYDTIQKMFKQHLACDVQLYNEYHALIVKVAKDFCRTKPLCEQCPLRCLFDQKALQEKDGSIRTKNL